jgi:hypothetical protein
MSVSSVSDKRALFLAFAAFSGGIFGITFQLAFFFGFCRHSGF